MSSVKPLGIAMLGAGLFATQAHLPALAQLTESTHLVAIYSHTLKSAATLADIAKTTLSLPSPPSVYHDQGGKDGDLHALLARPDVDAVIVALPITVQPDVIRSALSQGKHVLSEKPMAPSVAEGLQLLNEYDNQWKGKVIWRVAENMEAEPAYRKVGQLVKEGKIGEVVWWKLMKVSRLSKDSKWYKTPWRTVPEYQGGFLLDGGVHSAAVLRTALPSHPISLSAHVTLAQEHLEPSDTFNAVSLCSDGSNGVFELSMGAPVDSRGESALKITGKDGWIDVVDSSITRVILHSEANDGEKEQVFEFKSEGVKKEIEYFVDAIHGGKGGNIGDPREALRDVAFIEAGLKSKGDKIDLEKLLREGK